MSSGIVPIIDFAPFLTGDAAGKAAVAKELHTAATEVGFFMIKGYQSAISQDTVVKAFKTVRSLPSGLRAGRRGWGGTPTDPGRGW